MTLKNNHLVSIEMNLFTEIYYNSKFTPYEKYTNIRFMLKVNLGECLVAHPNINEEPYMKL